MSFRGRMRLSSIIEVKNLWKTYPLYNKPVDRLKEAIHPLRKKYHHDFHALKDLSFEVERGSTLGIVGKNGSGKSTLLKTLAGVLQPSQGQVFVRGRVSALLELGAGFNPELSGNENIDFMGMLMGMSGEEILAKREEIVGFADIGEFINQPVKTYSSGMYVRLAFAISTSINPEILIIDEALAVGDMYFQAKSMKRMKSLMDNGCTTIFVSHDISSIKSLCREVLYLQSGSLVQFGSAAAVCDRYVAEELKTGGFFQETTANLPDTRGMGEPRSPTPSELQAFESKASHERRGSGIVKISHVEITNEIGLPTSSVSYGEKVTISASLTAKSVVDEVVCAFYIRDKNQLEVIGTNNLYEGQRLQAVKAGSDWRIDFTFTNYLKAGNYSIQILLADSLSTTEYYDWIEIAAVFRSLDIPGRPRWALFNPPMSCTISHRSVQMESECTPTTASK